MISPELIRRYSFFAGLGQENLVALAKVGNEVSVPAGEYLFHEGDNLDHFYLVLEGEIAITIEVPDQAVEQAVSGQLTGKIQTKDIVISTVGPGQVFAWSALVPPYAATASGRAVHASDLVAFDCTKLREVFTSNPNFGFLMMQKAAQVTRERLRDMRIETLAYLAG